MSNPVSPKVIAAASGAGAGVIVSTLILWVLGASLFGGGWSAADADAAVKLVPLPLSGAVSLVLVLVGAAIPGYRTTDPQRITGADVPAGFDDGAAATLSPEQLAAQAE